MNGPQDPVPVIGVLGVTLAEAVSVLDGVLGRLVLLATLGYTVTKWALLWRHRHRSGTRPPQ
jgi:hypothetical protein